MLPWSPTRWILEKNIWSKVKIECTVLPFSNPAKTVLNSFEACTSSGELLIHVFSFCLTWSGRMAQWFRLCVLFKRSQVRFLALTCDFVLVENYFLLFDPLQLGPVPIQHREGFGILLIRNGNPDLDNNGWRSWSADHTSTLNWLVDLPPLSAEKCRFVGQDPRRLVKSKDYLLFCILTRGFCFSLSFVHFLSCDVFWGGSSAMMNISQGRPSNCVHVSVCNP